MEMGSDAEVLTWIELVCYNTIFCAVGLCGLFLLYRRAHTLRDTQLYAFVSLCPSVVRPSSSLKADFLPNRLVDGKVLNRGRIRLADEEEAEVAAAPAQLEGDARNPEATFPQSAASPQPISSSSGPTWKRLFMGLDSATQLSA